MNNNDYDSVNNMIHAVGMVNNIASLYNHEVGIHTFELKSYCQTSKGESQLQKVWDVLKAGHPQGKKMIRLINGLWAEMTYSLTEDWARPLLKMVVNPRVLVDGQEGYLGITDLPTLERSMSMFEDFWKERGIEMPINMCIFSRVDLCMNLQMHPSFWIVGYIDLLKRTPYCQKFTLCKFSNEEEDIHYVGFTNKNRRLCIYDKAYEQRRFSKRQASQCPNLMRVELQLYSGGIRKVIDQQPSVETKDHLRYMVRNAPRILCQGICVILPKEPYMDPQSVWRRVELHTELHLQTRINMKALVKQLARVDTYEEVVHRTEKTALRKICNAFVKIGVSPAVIRGERPPRLLPSLLAMVVKVLKESGKLI